MERNLDFDRSSSIACRRMPEEDILSRPSPSGRFAGLDIHVRASGIHPLRATDEDAAGGGSVKRCCNKDKRQKGNIAIDTRSHKNALGEQDKPASKFVFRARQDGGKMQYLLAEADGGAWRSEAMRNIKAFMEEAVQGLNVIA